MTVISDNITLHSAPQCHDELIERVLGSPQACPTTSSTSAQSINLDEAYANLIMDIELEPLDAEETETPKTSAIAKVLRQSQPYRERPSKDRSRRFMAGEIPLDCGAHDDHDLCTNQFWVIHPSNSVVRSANVFLLSHILYIAESGKPKKSSMKSNPNTTIILNLYDYDKESMLYHSSGRSGLLQAANILLMNVGDDITTTPEGSITFDHNSISDLSEFEPFHSDCDLTTKVAATSSSSTDNDDPYIVEIIEAKRFNSHKVQFEYKVKWLGYSCSENTWELPTNIPSSMLDAYEQAILDVSSREQPRRQGLRDRATRKILNKPDFIVNK